jgi:hypothetical protein
MSSVVDFPRLIDLKPAVLTAGMTHVHTPLAFVTTPEVHPYATWISWKERQGFDPPTVFA